MKVLLINHFPLEGSGSGTYVSTLASALIRAKVEVAIIAPQNQKNSNDIEKVRVFPVYFSKTYSENKKNTHKITKQTVKKDDGLSPEAPLPFNFPCFTTHPLSYVNFGDLSAEELQAYCQAFTARIEQLVYEMKPDIIHAQHIWILAALGARACLRHHIGLIITSHGTDLMGYQRWPKLRSFADEALKQAKCVISISNDNESLLKETFGAAISHKIVRIKNAYDPKIFSLKKMDPHRVLSQYKINADDYKHRILFAGKLTKFKGVDLVLKAAKLYEKLLPRTLTIIAGNGAERKKLYELAQELSLEGVRFIGHVDKQHLAQLYNICDLCLVPSRREPFGLVAIEAAACGAPVIASNSGGLREIVSDESGALTNTEDAQLFAKSICRLIDRTLKESSWRKDIAQKTYDIWSQDRVISDLIALYTQCS